MLRLQAHHDDVFGLGLGGVEIAKCLANRRMPLGFQKIQGKCDIARGQARSIVEPCLLAKKKAVDRLVRRNPHRARE